MTDRKPGNTVPAVQKVRILVSLKGAILFGVAMLLLMGLVHSTMTLSDINSRHHNAELELQKLRREAAVLARQVETSLSLGELEAYAVGELGMAKPSPEQFIYIGSPASDRAEIIRHEGILGRAKGILSAIGVRVTEFLD
jgi:hypothetical protein